MEAHRQTQGRKTGNGCLHREDVLKIHKGWVTCLASQFKCGVRASWADEQVHLGEVRIGGILYGATSFLSLAVVGVKVSAAQDEGPQKNAALHFGSKTFRAAALVEFVEGLDALGAVAVANAIKSSKVGAGLGSG